MTQLTKAPNEPLSPEELREALSTWRQAPISERPNQFPGAFVEKSQLDSWLRDSNSSRCMTRDPSIPQIQWVNVTLSWIPAGEEGETGFREQLLKYMRKKRRDGEWEIGRFWDWEQFMELFIEICSKSLSLVILLTFNFLNTTSSRC